ncbi:unnamed protein product [Acanthoscelides obtectus]|uniref:ubiquitinyl hydrolase 1 n=1 Tax=Acanthoscelides obtectus TaxID=200917 RepID=A0A9P0PT78_ACAOB|nr:unnamed protein product [Acanthoscelides obtectus]CAK1657271.1 Ubiquitin carboxyl-terminal hydrolase [Acanthoscelides obtectus]
MDLFPLESNPEVLTKFIHVLGVPDNFKLVDVYGLDDEPLSWLPRPVIAFILLFPCSEKVCMIFGYFFHAVAHTDEGCLNNIVFIGSMSYPRYSRDTSRCSSLGTLWALGIVRHTPIFILYKMTRASYQSKLKYF